MRCHVVLAEKAVSEKESQRRKNQQFESLSHLIRLTQSSSFFFWYLDTPPTGLDERVDKRQLRLSVMMLGLRGVAAAAALCALLELVKPP